MTKKQLFENYIYENVDRIYRFAYTYTKNQNDAEDVVNESVIKALKSIDSLKNTEYMGTWFYRIVINTAISHLRKSSRTLYLSPLDLENLKQDKDDFSAISFEEIINTLEPKYRSIVVLRFLEDRQLSEISEILGENINTIKTRLYKALDILRIEMEEVI